MEHLTICPQPNGNLQQNCRLLPIMMIINILFGWLKTGSIQISEIKKSWWYCICRFLEVKFYLHLVRYLLEELCRQSVSFKPLPTLQWVYSSQENSIKCVNQGIKPSSWIWFIPAKIFRLTFVTGVKIRNKFHNCYQNIPHTSCSVPGQCRPSEN